MNHAVRLVHIADSDHGDPALVVGDGQMVALLHDGERITFDGFEHRLAAAIGDGLHQVLCCEPAGHHVIGQHLDQGRLAFRLEQLIDRTGGQRRKGFVGRCKYGEWAAMAG